MTIVGAGETHESVFEKILKKNKSFDSKIETAALLFPVVGLGASSGGAEAFSLFLKEFPIDTGMAFVLIQHLDRTHSSLLPEAISKITEMRVLEITDGMKLIPNQVYVIPSTSEVGILHGKFTLFPRDLNSMKPNKTVDFFFRSLALDCGELAIGVVLSGNANDGTEGLRAIRTNGGTTFAQDPKTAKFTGMPESAALAQVADFCLAIPAIAKEVIRLSENLPLAKPRYQHQLVKVFELLRTEGIDFTEYKASTIKRRIARRMALLKMVGLGKYLKYLKDHPDEVKALAQDVLIHVTSFFRDPEVFQKLKETVYPEIIKDKGIEKPIRIWIAGCSSGEEVYSIIISFLEFLGDQTPQYSIQAFGTDVSEKMLEVARSGFYTEKDLKGLSAAHLDRYFNKVDGGYKISPAVRGLCLFVKHDLARDPPFSKIDLVSCRNVLIYFEHALQNRIISNFHYCLKQPGFLLLGRTETIASHQPLFFRSDKSNKIFMRLPVANSSRVLTQSSGSGLIERIQSPSNFITRAKPEIDITRQVDHMLLTQYAPAGVLINERMDILQYRGHTGPYLEAPPGQPEVNLFKMVREGLFTPLKIGIEQCKKKMASIRKENLFFKNGSISRACNLMVSPVISFSTPKESLFLVLFEEVDRNPNRSSSDQRNKKKIVRVSEKKSSVHAALLESELRATQEYLQSLNEEQQKVNDTLNNLNEEFVSGNEELQSMNEELETAKEELQSTNEELSTVNDELQVRNQETSEMNDDLMNLLNSSEIPILILDMNRRIRRFTPEARRLMNLIPTDIGRQIDDIRPNVMIDNLDQRVQTVIDTKSNQEFEVKDRSGKWHRLQIRPFKTSKNRVAGAVLSLINIDALRRAVIDAEWVSEYAESIVEAVQIPLLVLDGRIHLVSANRIFYETFKTNKNDAIGTSLYELNECQWNIGGLKQALGEMLEKKTFFQNVSVTCDSGEGGSKVMSLSARPIQSHNGITMILLAIEDITDRKNRERDRKELLVQAQIAKREAEKASLAKDIFLATLSHELRTPLTSLVLQAQMLQRGNMDDAKVKKACKAIERAAKTQSQLIEDLLDVSRIVTGKLKLELSLVDLSEIIRSAVETVTPMAENKPITIQVKAAASVGQVSGDPNRLQQVVWNLLSNAIKFTPKGGSILIELAEKDRFAEIQVTDEGIGITSEFLPQVFNRFSQSDDSNTRAHGGLGLGLAIVKHVIEMHGGSVRVESEGKDRGSKFTVLIPIHAEILHQTEFLELQSPALKDASHSEHGERKLVGMRILLVEDDDEVREALLEMLTQSGAEVRAASSSKEALIAFQEFAPTELLMDISMPEEDGYTLLKKIRLLNCHNSKTIPALALTALASEFDRAKAFESGFQMHLTKPLSIQQLTKALLELTSMVIKKYLL